MEVLKINSTVNGTSAKEALSLAMYALEKTVMGRNGTTRPMMVAFYPDLIASGTKGLPLRLLNVTFPNASYTPDRSHPDLQVSGLFHSMLLLCTLSAMLIPILVLRLYMKLTVTRWRGWRDWLALFSAGLAVAGSVTFTHVAAVAIWALQNATDTHWIISSLALSDRPLTKFLPTMFAILYLNIIPHKVLLVQLVFKVLGRRVTYLRLVAIAVMYEFLLICTSYLTALWISVPGFAQVPGIDQISAALHLEWHRIESPWEWHLMGVARAMATEVAMMVLILVCGSFMGGGWKRNFASLAVLCVGLWYGPSHQDVDLTAGTQWSVVSSLVVQQAESHLIIIFDTLMDVPALMKKDHPLTPTAMRRTWRRLKLLVRPLSGAEKEKDHEQDKELVDSTNYEEMDEDELDERARLIGRRMLGLEPRDRKTQIAPRPARLS